MAGPLAPANAIIIHYAVDWWRSLHQTATIRPTGAEIEGLMLFTWILAGAVFMVIWVWMMIHRFRIAYLTEQLDVHGRSVALEERRAEAGRAARLHSRRIHGGRCTESGRGPAWMTPRWSWVVGP